MWSGGLQRKHPGDFGVWHGLELSPEGAGPIDPPRARCSAPIDILSRPAGLALDRIPPQLERKPLAGSGSVDCLVRRFRGGPSRSISVPAPTERLTLLPADEQHRQRDHRCKADEPGGRRPPAQEGNSDREEAEVGREYQPALPALWEPPTQSESPCREPISPVRSVHLCGLLLPNGPSSAAAGVPDPTAFISHRSSWCWYRHHGCRWASTHNPGGGGVWLVQKRPRAASSR